MAYKTDFTGSFLIEPPLTQAHLDYLWEFSKVHHLARDWDAVARLDDPARKAAGLPIGVEGAYYTGKGQFGDSSVMGGPPGAPRVGWINPPWRYLTKAEETTLEANGNGTLYRIAGYKVIGPECTQRHEHGTPPTATGAECRRGFLSVGTDDEQPGFWCHWRPYSAGLLNVDAGGSGEGRYFYHYGEWLAYLIEHFLEPWGYTLSGRVDYQGEDDEDRGYLEVIANKAHRYQETTNYEEVGL